MRNLLVVLGHENRSSDADDKRHDLPELGEDALARANKAVAVLERSAFDGLVTTGAFGPFNQSDIPHGKLLLEHIVTRLSENKRARLSIQRHLPTGFTLDDLFAVRRLVEDDGFEEVTVVTSGYHEARVKWILRKVFPDRHVKVELAQDRFSSSARKVFTHEEDKLARLKREWVNTPLYFKKADFPTHIYENAMEQYKHSDTVQIALITAALAVLFFVLSKEKSAINSQLGIGACVIAFVFEQLYLRFVLFAYQSRQVMCISELAWGVPGFSTTHCKYSPSRRVSSLLRVKIWIRILVYGMILATLVRSECPLWFVGTSVIGLLVVFIAQLDEVKLWRYNKSQH